MCLSVKIYRREGNREGEGNGCEGREDERKANKGVKKGGEKTKTESRLGGKDKIEATERNSVLINALMTPRGLLLHAVELDCSRIFYASGFLPSLFLKGRIFIVF